ncbi:MAG TPA: ribbon-helix-helix protein, CopG family [Micromonosporaceae bacterium]|nr:ribbon-helix-helix protein, CopG family [Micromonosporaceae bacterium]
MSGQRLSKAELQRLSAEELVAYIETGGDWFDGAGSNPPQGVKPAQLPDVADLRMQVTSVRLPLRMIEELDRRAGRDRDGRSGIVREAVAEWLARHPTDEAA